MTWNYAAVQIQTKEGPYWGIKEIFHMGDNVRLGWTTGFMIPGGDTYEELIDTLEKMLKDAKNRERYLEVNKKLQLLEVQE